MSKVEIELEHIHKIAKKFNNEKINRDFLNELFPNIFSNVEINKDYIYILKEKNDKIWKAQKIDNYLYKWVCINNSFEIDSESYETLERIINNAGLTNHLDEDAELFCFKHLDEFIEWYYSDLKENEFI